MDDTPPNPAKAGYTIIAVFGHTDEERSMALRAKQDAIKRGRKCFVNIPTCGTHAGMICLWLRKKDLVAGETPEQAGKKKSVARIS